MSEEPLERSQQALDDAREAARETPVMPFGDSPTGETPEETGGAVAEHGDDETDGFDGSDGAPDETEAEATGRVESGEA